MLIWQQQQQAAVSVPFFFSSRSSEKSIKIKKSLYIYTKIESRSLNSTQQGTIIIKKGGSKGTKSVNPRTVALWLFYLFLSFLFLC